MPSRPISPRLHGIFDYAGGASLLAAPKLLGLSGKASGRALRAVGATTVTAGAMTKTEVGVAKVVPLKTHLALDAATGLALAASPWLLGFKGERRTGARSWLPHVVVGVSYVAGAFLTSTGAGDAVAEAEVVAKPPAPASSPEVVMPDGAEANASIGARTIGKRN